MARSAPKTSRPPTKKDDGGGIKNRTLFTGDNLYVLRGIPDACIDLIYLDPPFKSDHNYAAPIGSKAAGAAFKDTWTLSDIDEEWIGEIADINDALYQVLEMTRNVAGNSMLSYMLYMSIRIIEMHRVLKDTGSLYLHCDSTAVHYLKTALDAIFGRKMFVNEIVWKRFNTHNDGAKKFGNISDMILCYSRSKDYTFNKHYLPYDDDYIKSQFRYSDERGRYKVADLTAESLKGGGYRYTFHGHERVWKRPRDSMMELERNGLVHLPKKKGGIPGYKIYLDDAKGVPCQNMWMDIGPVKGTEKLGYPTQKPLALLERIITCSSNPGDFVLDPFCGCATACSAAEKLGRKWIGIDISEKAYELVQIRLKKEAGIEHFTTGKGRIVHRIDVPVRHGHRTPDIKHRLFGVQEGKCGGCRVRFEFRNLEIDHILPRADGGLDDDSNLQLLCGSCNRIKGDRDMAYLRMRLKELGVG